MFFQSSGFLSVKKGEPLFGDSMGVIEKVKLIEVTVLNDGTYHSTPVEGGECIDIQTASWNFIPKCDENSTRCSEDKKAIEICNDKSEWVSEECNSKAPICENINNKATCVVCVPNTKRCSKDGNVEACKEDGSAWEVIETCTAPKTCNENSFTCLAKGDCIGVSFENAKQYFLYPYAYSAKNEEFNLKLSLQFHKSSPKGVYDLGSSENSNFSTCGQCVLINRLDENGNIKKQFFQESGTLEVLEGDAKEDGSSGKITSAKLIEVKIDSKYNSTPVKDGECYEIQANTIWTWGEK